MSYQEECEGWDRASESERFARLVAWGSFSDEESLYIAKTPGSMYFGPELECYKSPNTLHDWVYPRMEDSVDKHREILNVYCRYCLDQQEDVLEHSKG